jgi:Rab GDP dissociation inhibitor
LYTQSMARYGKSPYIYPLYGLGELPQSFARLSAIYGGTYMLDKKIDEVVTDPETGKFVGVRSGDETVKAKQVVSGRACRSTINICTTYLVNYIRSAILRTSSPNQQTPQARSVCSRVTRSCARFASSSTRSPVPMTRTACRSSFLRTRSNVGTVSSCFTPAYIHLNYLQLSDIYIAMVSSTHNVCAKDIYVAIVSTIVETDRPEQEIQPGLALLGPIHEKYFPNSCPKFQFNILCRFVSVTPLYEPTSPGTDDNIFVTRSYDATSHFETVVEDVRDVWKRVVGSDLVLKKREVEVTE